MSIASVEWRDFAAYGQRCLQWLSQLLARESRAVANPHRASDFSIELLQEGGVERIDVLQQYQQQRSCVSRIVRWIDSSAESAPVRIRGHGARAANRGGGRGVSNLATLTRVANQRYHRLARLSHSCRRGGNTER